MRCKDCGREISVEDVEAYGERVCGRCAIGYAYMECDHEWEYPENWREDINFIDGETIGIPVVCKKCGKVGEEIWIYSRTEEDSISIR